MRNSSALALVLLSLSLFSFSTSGFAASHKPGSIDTKPQNTPVPDQPVSNQTWWPDQLDLSPLRAHASESNPMGADFSYAEAFKTLDLDAVKADIATVLTTPQAWWPSDYGNYGPFFIRMAWHSAGTYRVVDGRGGSSGGEQRFEPLNSWPDNANLDKARRLLLPIKEKYGEKLSWGDLMVLTGNVALEQMGFKTIGFGGGRIDAWEPDLVYWGPEKKFLASQNERHVDGKLKKPLGASQMGLIYVNPQGPNGNPDPIAAADEIRQTFGRMAMNDEETVALIAGGHTFGKAHGAHDATKCLGPEPAAAGLEQQGTGWKNKCGTGHGDDTVTSGLEGAWSGEPTKFTMNYLNNLFKFDWVKTKSPAGAIQWMPKQSEGKDVVPDAQDPSLHHPLMMFTTDLALKFDPKYREIALRFKDHPEEFSDAFAKAWFKLTHRDMGPRSRYLGNEVPKEAFLWQDPVPVADNQLIDDSDIASLKSKILNSGLTSSQLVKTAWASAASYRKTDKRGGANGARIRLAPEKDWAVNDPDDLAVVLSKLETIKDDFDKNSGGTKVSLADVIVLGGNAAIEQAAKKGGYDVKLPFKPGRTDATQDQTDVESFGWLEPKADGFRNFYGADNQASPSVMLINRADLLNLTVPQMTVLIGGLRVLDANDGHSDYGVLTSRPGVLSNDFFINLLDMSTEWKKSTSAEGVYEGMDRATGQHKWEASSVDLLFGSNSELRAVSEFYASDDAREKFIKDFFDAWTKVMNNDRFDM